MRPAACISPKSLLHCLPALRAFRTLSGFLLVPWMSPCSRRAVLQAQQWPEQWRTQPTWSHGTLHLSGGLGFGPPEHVPDDVCAWVHWDVELVHLHLDIGRHRLEPGFWYLVVALPVVCPARVPWPELLHHLQGDTRRHHWAAMQP